ncbi:MAG: cytochrome c oxidase assembly protein, partial [Gemmatimonadota bacterium]
MTLAHAGLPLEPHDLWSAWGAGPAVAAGLLLAGWVYARGVESAWRRAGAGRGIRAGQAAAAAGGWLALWLALATPLDPLGGALFSAHMAQHLVLVLVAA